MLTIQYSQISKLTLMRAQSNIRNISTYSYQPSRSPNRLARELIDGAHEYARQESILIQRARSYLNSRFNYYHSPRCHSRSNTIHRERGEQLANRAQRNMSHLEQNTQVREACNRSKKRALKEERDEPAKRLCIEEDHRNRAGQSKQEPKSKQKDNLVSKKCEKSIKKSKCPKIDTGDLIKQPKNRISVEKSQTRKNEVGKLSKRKMQTQPKKSHTLSFQNHVLQEKIEMKIQIEGFDKKAQYQQNRNESRKQENLIPKSRPEINPNEEQSYNAQYEVQRVFEEHYLSPTQYQQYLNNRTQKVEPYVNDFVEEQYKTTSLNMSFGVNQSDQEAINHLKRSQGHQNSKLNESLLQMLEKTPNPVLNSSGRYEKQKRKSNQPYKRHQQSNKSNWASITQRYEHPANYQYSQYEKKLILFHQTSEENKLLKANVCSLKNKIKKLKKMKQQASSSRRESQRKVPLTVNQILYHLLNNTTSYNYSNSQQREKEQRGQQIIHEFVNNSPSKSQGNSFKLNKSQQKKERFVYNDRFNEYDEEQDLLYVNEDQKEVNYIVIEQRSKIQGNNSFLDEEIKESKRKEKILQPRQQQLVSSSSKKSPGKLTSSRISEKPIIIMIPGEDQQYRLLLRIARENSNKIRHVFIPQE